MRFAVLLVLLFPCVSLAEPFFFRFRLQRPLLSSRIDRCQKSYGTSPVSDFASPAAPYAQEPSFLPIITEPLSLQQDIVPRPGTGSGSGAGKKPPAEDTNPGISLGKPGPIPPEVSEMLRSFKSMADRSNSVMWWAFVAILTYLANQSVQWGAPVVSGLLKLLAEKLLQSQPPGRGGPPSSSGG